MRWLVSDGRGTRAGKQFPANQGGEFVFDHDIDQIDIPIEITADLADGQTVQVQLAQTRTYDFQPIIARRIAAVSTAPSAAPTWEGDELRSRLWNQPPRRIVSQDWRRDFYSNLVDDFQCTASGYTAAGRPCFINQLSHGRGQFNNGEVGLYSDPSEHGTNPLQMHEGRRLLIPEKLEAPVTLVSNGKAKAFTHSVPIVSTEKNALLGYGRFEYRFALRDMQTGCWPAGWQLCLPHFRWPECEQDTVEINFKSDPRQTLPFQTNWSGRPGTGGSKEGQFANVYGLLSDFRYSDFHTYWSEWSPERMSFGIDEVLMFSCPNRFFLNDPDDIDDPNRVFMMLQIALGGAGGNVARGRYPTAPSVYAAGQPAMLVEHIAHYSSRSG